ncbi:hypothetical protein F5B17DRAFT_436026 [Nemania serpens]|nr:hypothetical protein F5B17DRAFT_436026 [Nemania serpens]
MPPTFPIPEPDLNFNWDCRGHEYMPRQLVNSWATEATLRAEPGPKTASLPSSLSNQQIVKIQAALKVTPPEILTRVKKLLRVPKQDYLSIREKLLSLLIGWEKVIQEKERYDASDSRYGLEGLNPHEFYILIDTLWNTARLGQKISVNRSLHTLSNDHDGSATEAKPRSSNGKAAVPYVPVEIWHDITTWLDPFDKLSFLATHKGASGVLTHRQLKHSRFWTRIFKNDSWISKVLAHGFQPVVIGCQLDKVFDYMILALAGDVSEIPDSLRDPVCLLQSLRSQTFTLENLEVIFERFTLNVCHILELGNVIDVPDPKEYRSDTEDISISYYEDISSYFIRPLFVAESIAIISHQFQGQQNWFIRERDTEPGLRRLQKCPLGISQEWFLSRMNEMSPNR